MTNSKIKVLGSPNQNEHCQHILRRGIDSGYVQLGERAVLSVSTAAKESPDAKSISSLWQANQPIFIGSLLKDNLNKYSDAIAQSRRLYEAILNEDEVDDILDAPPYSEQLGERFQILSSRFDESDRQEIISIDFDVMDGDTLLMEDIWMRISWLSYHEEDESFRFRFSFGMENFDDVSTDPERQLAAAELSQCIFPESAIITENPKLIELIRNILNATIKTTSSFNFVERIVYFNAPNGGAQFHHDAEKGHLGVVYAQITGETFWLALSRSTLIDEILRFASNDNNLEELKDLIIDEDIFSDLADLLKDKSKISALLDDPSNVEISVLLNESTLFFKQLVEAGFAYHLIPGDVILLPQESMDSCAWHSVFCIGDEAGEALSFAIKPA